MTDAESDVLQEIRDLLRSFSEEISDYEDFVLPLNRLVLGASQNETYRNVMASSEKIWRRIGECFLAPESYHLRSSNEETRFWYFRIYKGVVLLARNLCVDNQEYAQKLTLQDKLFKSFNILAALPRYDEIEIALFKTSLEFLCNATAKSTAFDKSSMQHTLQFLCYPIGNRFEGNEPLLISYALLIRNLTAHDDFVYYFLKADEAHQVLHEFLLLQITEGHTKLPSTAHDRDFQTSELSTLTTVVISALMRICCHESFAPFIQNIQEVNPTIFLDYLKISHLLITSYESWDKFQLTSIMTWSYKLLVDTVTQIRTYFENSHNDEDMAAHLHGQLVIVLDMFTTLSPYEHVREFLIFYKGIDLLVSLLHVFQTELLRFNIYKLANGEVSEVRVMDGKGQKVTNQELIDSRIDRSTGLIKPTNFPECKLLVVEIISFLAHNNRKVQDKIRELQGLEVVLSNCVIDDNDPFIKERSIMCIKHLLQDNEENQYIVAQMEAKTAVQDSALSSAGYQINIGDNGKVQLAQNKTV
ncbi:LAQU0S09e02982g1_1 [Lachancea quebecensis]|uniref:Ataxin-10 homolog n=1 Tax=Lachancea quebecensis TaxID=1654605 RepID=A0A0P1KTI8_9SACH|nr:LAQU0S09e02982g1_1 [Lachancea quebecensis]